MTAADILRERAERLEFSAKHAGMSPVAEWRKEAAEWRAVAELMDYIRDQSPACVFQDGADGVICLLCRHTSEDGKPEEHNAWCPLAALERLITEARDADR